VTPSATDHDELDRWWDDAFGVEPVPYQLRDRLPERWVRFHSLPEAKRYPDSPLEMEQILSRYHRVIDIVLRDPDTVTVVIGRFVDEGTTLALPSEPPDLVSWRTVVADYDPDQPDETIRVLLAVTHMDRRAPALDELLRAVAEWREANVMLLAPPVPALLHPYDGGTDVITESSFDRDALRSEFQSWLSPHPRGL